MVKRTRTEMEETAPAPKVFKMDLSAAANIVNTVQAVQNGNMLMAIANGTQAMRKCQEMYTRYSEVETAAMHEGTELHIKVDEHHLMTMDYTDDRSFTLVVHHDGFIGILEALVPRPPPPIASAA